MKKKFKGVREPNEAGRKIKELREKFKLSQEEFGKRIGAQQCFVSMWETGIRNPSFNSVKRICDSFGLTLYEFYNNAGSDKRSEDDKKLDEYLGSLREHESLENVCLVNWLEELKERRALAAKEGK